MVCCCQKYFNCTWLSKDLSSKFKLWFSPEFLWRGTICYFLNCSFMQIIIFEVPCVFQQNYALNNNRSCYVISQNFTQWVIDSWYHRGFPANFGMWQVMYFCWLRINRVCILFCYAVVSFNSGKGPLKTQHKLFSFLI